MDPSRQSANLSSNLRRTWKKRVIEAQIWNTSLDDGDDYAKPKIQTRIKWKIKSLGRQNKYEEFETKWRQDARKTPSLLGAVYEAYFWQFWFGGW